jgi:DNA-binding NarL/FixJ family response regulator
MRLLIVEENPDMRRLMRSLVEELAVSVAECADGARVLEACAEARPDWVVLDLDLAAADGLAAARQIRDAHPDARVLVVADDDSARLRAATRDAGAAGYVPKEDLLSVRSFLQRGL